MEAPSILFNWSDFLSDLAACRRLRSKCQPLPAGHHGFRYSHLTVDTSARLQVNGNTTQPSPQSRVRVRTDFSDNYLWHRSQRISPLVIMNDLLVVLFSNKMWRKWKAWTFSQHYSLMQSLPKVTGDGRSMP